MPNLKEKKERKSQQSEFFNDLVLYREIDRATFIKIFEESILSILKKKSGSDNYSVIFNPKNEDIEIIRTYKVVSDNDDYNDEDCIAISIAQQIDEDFEVGDEVSETVDIDIFNRTQLMNLRNVIVEKIKRVNKQNNYNSYKDLVGEIITAEIVKHNKNEIILKYDNVIIILPATNKLDKDNFVNGKLVKVYIDKINDTYKDIIISANRNSKEFIKKILEAEFSVIQSGEINIEDVIIVGDRIKVIVDTQNDNIDPVSYMVGKNGRNLYNLRKDLSDSYIEIIKYTSNKSILLERLLGNANAKRINFNTNSIDVWVNADNMGKAIGKYNVNLRSAEMYFNTKVNIINSDKPVDNDDVDLIEFSDEIDPIVVQILMREGYTTGKDVLKLTLDDLQDICEIDRDEAFNILSVIRKEFDII